MYEHHITHDKNVCTARKVGNDSQVFMCKQCEQIQSPS